MPVPDLLVPYLQRLAPYAVQDGQEPGLEGVLEHVRSRTELFLGMFHFSPSEFQGLTKLGKTGRQVLESSSRGLSPVVGLAHTHLSAAIPFRLFLSQ